MFQQDVVWQAQVRATASTTSEAKSVHQQTLNARPKWRVKVATILHPLLPVIEKFTKIHPKKQSAHLGKNGKQTQLVTFHPVKKQHRVAAADDE